MSSGIELFRMSLLYPKDVDEVFDRINSIQKYLQLSSRDFSRLCSCSLELARLGLLFTEGVPIFSLMMHPSESQAIDVIMLFKTRGTHGMTPELVAECQKRSIWLSNFGAIVSRNVEFR